MTKKIYSNMRCSRSMKALVIDLFKKHGVNNEAGYLYDRLEKIEETL